MTADRKVGPDHSGGLCTLVLDLRVCCVGLKAPGSLKRL